MTYTWICCWDNCSSDWKDSERCGATSRKKYKSWEEAKSAALAHESRSGHRDRCHVIAKARRKVRRTTKRKRR